MAKAKYDYFFFHSPAFQLKREDGGEWRVVGEASAADGSPFQLEDAFLPYFVDDFDDVHLTSMQYTYAEHKDTKDERFLDAINFLEFVMLRDGEGKPVIRYMGYNELYEPTQDELDAWVEDNIAPEQGAIARDKYAAFFETENYEYFVPDPRAELAQHALAIAPISTAGSQWLYRQTGAFAAWGECTPQVQLMVRLVALMEIAAEETGATAKRMLGAVRRYMKVPISEYANGDMLRVVHAHFSDNTTETSLLNLFLAHANIRPSAPAAALDGPHA